MNGSSSVAESSMAKVGWETVAGIVSGYQNGLVTKWKDLPSASLRITETDRTLKFSILTV